MEKLLRDDFIFFGLHNAVMLSLTGMGDVGGPEDLSRYVYSLCRGPLCGSSNSGRFAPYCVFIDLECRCVKCVKKLASFLSICGMFVGFFWCNGVYHGLCVLLMYTDDGVTPKVEYATALSSAGALSLYGVGVSDTLGPRRTFPEHSVGPSPVHRFDALSFAFYNTMNSKILLK